MLRMKKSRLKSVPLPSTHRGRSNVPGLKLLAEGHNSVADIIAIHGLNGHWKDSWTASNGTFWLRDLLPHDIPNTRIFSYGYDASINRPQAVSKQIILSQAVELISALAYMRSVSETAQRPIIFVAHSYGGIVLKSALLYSDAASKVFFPKHREIKSSTYGVIFLGTPHRGTIGASIAMISENISRLSPKLFPLTAHLPQNFEWLQSQSSSYLLISKEFVTKCYYENRVIPGRQKLIVPREHAVLPMSTERSRDSDHFQIAKFSTAIDGTYQRLINDFQLITIGAVKSLSKEEIMIGKCTLLPDLNETALHFAPCWKLYVNWHIDRPWIDPGRSNFPFLVMPYRRDIAFLGHEQILQSLERTLREPGEHQRVTLMGFVGIGKTSLVREFVFRLCAKESNISVFWVDARTKTHFEQSYCKIANTLALPGIDDSDIDVLMLVKLWLQQPDIGRWLMILDDVDDPLILPVLLAYLPRRRQGTIILTSQNQSMEGELSELCDDSDLIYLSPMDHSDARELLMSSLMFQERGEEMDLVLELDYLPLAIKLATGFINYHSITVATYLKLLRSTAAELPPATESGGFVQDQVCDWQDQPLPRMLVTSWKLSYDMLRLQRGKAAVLLSLLTMLDPHRIPKILIEKGFHQEAYRLWEDWHTLQALNMIEVEDDRRYLSLPWVIQCLVWRRLDADGELSTSQEKALLLLAEGFPKISSANRILCARCMPHADAVLQYSNSGRGKSSLLVQTAAYFQQLGCYQIAEARTREALAIQKVELGTEHFDTLRSIIRLGGLLYHQGKYKAAKETLSGAQTTTMQVLGRDHPAALELTCHTTLVLVSLGEYEEAEATARELSEKHIRLLGREHPSTLNCLSVLALALMSQGEVGKAELIYVEVLKLRKTVLGDEHLGTLDTISSLARVMQRQGKHNEAEVTHQKVLKVRERVLGEEHPSTLDTLSNLAFVYEEQGKLEEAEIIYWQALEGRGRILGQEHPHTLALRARVLALISAKATSTGGNPISQPATSRSSQPSHATSDFGAAPLLSNVPAPASPGPTTSSAGVLAVSGDSALKISVIETFIESLVQDEILAPLFVTIFERNVSAIEFTEKFTHVLDGYSAELRMEAEADGALETAVALIIRDEARQITTQLSRMYTPVRHINDAGIGGCVAHSAETSMNTMEQRARRTLQQILASARDYSVYSLGYDSTKRQFQEQVLMPIFEDRRDAADLSEEEFRDRVSFKLLISSNAFSNLRSSVRQFMLPDMMKAIHREVASKLQNSTNGRHSVTFSVCWGARKYISEEFDPGQALGPVLTLSGNATNAYATSCAEYMSWNWPKTGSAMLDAIQTAVQVETYNDKWSSEYTWSTGLRARVKSERPETITVHASGPGDNLVDIAQQLGWLAACFRVSEMNELTYSDIDFRTLDYAETPHFQLNILDLRPLKEAERTCWHPLFANSVIARGFPIPKRTAELGLELPFEVMLSLAHITHVVLHNDAIVLNGFSTILFPTAQYHPSQAIQRRSSIQWHFLSSGNDHQRILSGEALAKHYDCWLKISNVETLRTARTFLGYCNAVCIHLGTERSGYEGITHSSLPEDKPPAELSIRSGNVGTSGLGIFGGNLTMDLVLPKTLSKVTKVDCYDDILSTAKTEPLLLYDAEKQQGWLVSMLSVILHMVHAWASEHVPNVQIPHADLDWNGGQAAFNVIAGHSKLELRKSLEDDTPYYLKDLVKRLWYDLISCIDAMSLQSRRSKGSVRMGPPRLRGWEFRDILDPPVLRHMKEEKIDSKGCGWDLLTEEMLVLVCEGLGEVIQPAEPEKVCGRWSPIPREMKYLTASVACLQQLSKRRGMGQDCTKLTDTLFWRPPGDRLFQNCAHDDSTRCSKLPQQLVKDAKLDPASQIEVPEKGAVIFGKSTNKLRKERMGTKSKTNSRMAFLETFVFTADSAAQ